MKIESIPTSTKTEQDLDALAEAVQLALVTLATLGDRLLHLERAVFGFGRQTGASLPDEPLNTVACDHLQSLLLGVTVKCVKCSATLGTKKAP